MADGYGRWAQEQGLVETELIDGDEVVVAGDVSSRSTRERYALCPTCEGRGTHVNPAIDAHGIGREEFDEDPEFEESYFSGTYDVRCAECGGNRVVLACTEGECDRPRTPKQRGWGDHRDSVSREHYETCYEHLSEEDREEIEDLADMYATMAAEQRMGA